MYFASPALLKHAIQCYSLRSSPALNGAVEISLLIPVRAGTRWNQYTITEIVTKMHRINRKLDYLKSCPFLLNREVSLLSPVHLGLGCLDFVARAPHWAWELCLGIVVAAATAHVTLSSAWGAVTLHSSEGSHGSLSMPWYARRQKQTFATWSTVSSEKYAASLFDAAPFERARLFLVALGLRSGDS